SNGLFSCTCATFSEDIIKSSTISSFKYLSSCNILTYVHSFLSHNYQQFFQIYNSGALVYINELLSLIIVWSKNTNIKYRMVLPCLYRSPNRSEERRVGKESRSAWR